MFWVISVYFNIRNTLPKFGTFFLGHSVFVSVGRRDSIVQQWLAVASRFNSEMDEGDLLFSDTFRPVLGPT